MPARTKKIRHDEDTRKKIQGARIIQRLQRFALGEKEKNGTSDWQVVEMSAQQVAASLGLLRKILPDLQVTDLQVSDRQNYVARMPAKSQDADEWQTQYAPTTIQ